VQSASGRYRVETGAPLRRPLALQRLPHRAPVLRRRFHHHFVHSAFHEPRGQHPQGLGPRAHRASVKRVLPTGGDVSDHHREHPLVHINTGDPIAHHALLGARRERASFMRYSGSRAPTGPTYSLNSHAPDHPVAPASTAPVHETISPRAPALFSPTRTNFHPVSRADEARYWPTTFGVHPAPVTSPAPDVSAPDPSSARH
jgi:hypothetical protein